MMLTFSGANNRMDGYSYDAAGNLLNDGSHNYTYDAENRIIAVDSGNTATYVYDPEGHRAVVTLAAAASYTQQAGTAEFLYDLQGRRIEQLAPNAGTGWASEVYAGSRHLASYVGNATIDHADWLGTERSRDWVDPYSHALQNETCTSLPFGDALTCVGGGDPTPLHFTGKEHDFSTGLDNFAARYDSSSLGRFISPDDPNADQNPADPQSWNLYTYVRNNPLNNTDPTGNACVQMHNADGSTFYKDDGGPGQTCAEARDPKNNTPSAVVSANAPPSADDQRILDFASELNKRNVLNNTLKIAGAGALIGISGGTACYYLCSAATITTVGVTVSGVGTAAAPLVTNPNLQNIVNKLFQASDELPGGTAGAVTYELKMGDLLSQAGHSEKATTTITALTNLLKSGSLSGHDQMVARQLIQQLSNALATKPFGQNP